jgi:hypothetical protein
MDARVKPGHDESGGGDVSERPWEGEGGCQPLFNRTTDPETAGDLPAQQE